MGDLLLLYSLITAIVFCLAVLSVDWQGTSPRISAIVALTCWAWPAWVVAGFLWVVLLVIVLAFGLGQDKPPEDERHKLLSRNDLERVRELSPEMYDWHMLRRRDLHLGGRHG